jgi:thiamine monophosphate synthase
MVLVSPVFASTSHPQTPPLGVFRFAALCRRARVPVYALGGLSVARIPRLKHSTAVGVAGIDMFLPPVVDSKNGKDINSGQTSAGPAGT